MNDRWIYTYDYPPESRWDAWRKSDDESAWIAAEAEVVAGRASRHERDVPGGSGMENPTVNEGETIGNRHLATYILLADSHFAYNGTWDDTAASMRAMVDRIPIDGIIHLGDLTDGLLPLAETMEIEDRVMADMGSLGAPVHVVPGNHDYNYFRNNPEVRYPDKPRYYVDEFRQGLWLVFIDSFDPGEEVRYGFTNECIQWLDETLDAMPQDHKAVVFSHVPPLVRLQAWTNNIRGREKLIGVLDKHADSILALINGHNHCDHLFNDLKNGRFPIISINCAKCEYFLEHKPHGAVVPYRRLGDRTQESFDIMQVDAHSNEIYFTRFGAGGDRVVTNHMAVWT